MSSVYNTPEWAAWLASIREMPDDDNRRLVAADFLEERGEGERAELIRVQCDPLYTLPCEQVEYPLAGVDGLETYSDIEVRCLCYHDGRTPPQDRWCPQCKARHRAMQIIEAGDDENTRHVPHPFNADGWTGFVVKTYDRGFVHTVRGPLGSLIGGECWRCASRRRMARQIDRLEGEAAGVDATGLADDLMNLHDPCPDCNGTGKTPGVLRELVRREPVAFVEVTDRETQQDDISDLPFCWRRGGTLSARYCLPSEVWDILEGYKPQGWQERGGHGWLCSYPTPDTARAALSAALLRLVQPVEVPT